MEYNKQAKRGGLNMSTEEALACGLLVVFIGTPLIMYVIFLIAQALGV